MGEQKKVIEVEECSSLTLAAVIGFMYGINIPEDLSMEDTKGLLLMADLYLMEDLKAVVAFMFIGKMNRDNLL